MNFPVSELFEKFDNQFPEFCIVQTSQLIKLLQRCPNCGKLPQGKSFGKPRNIKWTISGTNMKAVTRCSCVGTGKIRWATQDFIPGTLIFSVCSD